MGIEATLHDDIALMDPRCDARLLPGYLRGGDNAARVKQYHRAIAKANLICLNDVERQYIQLYYGEQQSKRRIAAMQGKSWAAVDRSLKAAEQKVKRYVELYMDLYDELRRQVQLEYEQSED